MNLFIGNLPYDVTESDISALCGSYGEIVGINLVKDQYSGESKGFAFVEMANRSGGQQAMEALNKQVFRSRQLSCSEARPKKKGKRRR